MPLRYVSVTTGKRFFSPNNQTRGEKPLSVGLVAAVGKLRGEEGRRELSNTVPLKLQGHPSLQPRWPFLVVTRLAVR